MLFDVLFPTCSRRCSQNSPGKKEDNRGHDAFREPQQSIWTIKRAAHSVPKAEVRTRFSDLDEAIDVLVQLTEKYTRLILVGQRKALEPLHHAGQPTIYPQIVQMEKNIDLLQEMKRRKLPRGWDSIFLEAWATPEILSSNLGEKPPPDK